MPSLWRPWSRRPPSPFVEDEFESLSHELGGLSLLGEKPGVEGACERGTIDQLPILLDIERSATADTDISSSQPPSLTSQSSEESFGPPTPPPEGIPNTPLRKGSQRDPGTSQVSNPFPGSSFPTQSYSSRIPNSQASNNSHVLQLNEKGSLNDQRENLSYHNFRHGQAQATSSSKYSALRSLETSNPTNSPKQRHPHYFEPSKKPTVAELLEEKLRLRREQQLRGEQQAPRPYGNTRLDERISQRVALQPSTKIDLESAPMFKPNSPTSNPSVDSSMVQYISYPISPNNPNGYVMNGQTSNFGTRNSPSYENISLEKEGSFFAMRTPAQNLAHSSRGPLVSEEPPNRQRRAVSFLDEPIPSRYRTVIPTDLHRQISDPSPAHSSRPESPPKRTSTRAPELPSFALRPCPRSTPAAGYQDWYTISGLTHLNICPSCMNQIGNSRFRDYFVPSLPNLRARIHCSFSEPWTRLAWIQTIKKGHDNLDMLYEITRPSNVQCPGRKLSAENWYRIVDHQTGSHVPRFAACPACVRNLRLLMPPLRQSFSCQAVVQEKICDFAVDSPRFVQYLDLLDAAANHCEYERLRFPDTSKFIDYAERKCNLRDCRRDRLILGTWHYIPGLPEFTVCEDCYDDVIRPLAAAHKPIARMMANPPRLLPGSGPNRCREASCQLYSPRMRARFREAVLNDDYRMLESAALKRFHAEQRFRDREEALLLVAETDRGLTWQEEWHQNREEWKKYE